jgi:hypothetical protein
LVAYSNDISVFSTSEKREGIVVKVIDGNNILNRYKMIRSDFQQGAYWSVDRITKHILRKE